MQSKTSQTLAPLSHQNYRPFITPACWVRCNRSGATQRRPNSLLQWWNTATHTCRLAKCCRWPEKCWKWRTCKTRRSGRSTRKRNATTLLWKRWAIASSREKTQRCRGTRRSYGTFARPRRGKTCSRPVPSRWNVCAPSRRRNLIDAYI